MFINKHAKLLKYRFKFKKHNDVWICSYPRSGNTWLRYMLHDVLYGHNDDPTRIRKSIPDIHKGISLAYNTDVQFFKSHFMYSRHYPKIIYVVRDPVDVIYSYWRRETNKNKRDVSLLSFVNEVLAGNYFGGWGNHVLSFLNNCNSVNRILWLFYEDMIEQPNVVLNEILDFCSIKDTKEGTDDVAERHIDKFLKSKNYINFNINNKDYAFEEKISLVKKLQVGKGCKSIGEREKELLLESKIGFIRRALGYKKI